MSSYRSVDAIERWEDEGGALKNTMIRRKLDVVDAQFTGIREQQQTLKDLSVHPPDANLPTEIADWFAKPLIRFFKIEVAAAVTLLVATLVALILGNSGWASPISAFWEVPLGLRIGTFEFSRTLRHWINDGLMTLFFFVIALELKRELVLGELKHLRTAALSFAGALGGMVVPAVVFLAIMGVKAGGNGWGIVTATDTAFALGCLALLGSRVPPSLRLFVLSLAIFDDVGAILVIAIGYGQSLNWLALSAAAFGLVTLAGVAYVGIRSVPVYIAFGSLVWLCLDASGIHPTVAGVALGLLTPTTRWITNVRMRAILGRVLSRQEGENANGDSIERKELQQAGRAARESDSPLERLERSLHPWVGFAVLPIFALANTGVKLSNASMGEPLFAAVFFSFILGKPMGVFALSWLAVRLGVAVKPPGLTWPLIAGGALLTGIGFTMALFIARLALNSSHFDIARISILFASLSSALAGITILFCVTSSKRTAHNAALDLLVDIRTVDAVPKTTANRAV